MQKQKRKILAVICVSTAFAIAAAIIIYKVTSKFVTMIALNHEAMNYTSALHSAVDRTGTLPRPPISLKDRTLLLKSSGQPLTPSKRQYVFPILDAESNWLFDVDTPNSGVAPVLVLIPEGLSGEYAVVLTKSGPKLVSSEATQEFSLNRRILWTYGGSSFLVPDGMSQAEVSEYLLGNHNGDTAL